MTRHDAACDVAIVGAGVAGCALALVLARRGCSVALLEREPADGLRVGEHLAPDGRAALERLGLGAAFAADAHLPCSVVAAAWGQAEPAERDYLFNAFGPGWNLDRARFERMLTDAVQRAGARLWRPARLRALQRAAGGWQLAIEHGGAPRHLMATMLVDASGRAAVVARRLGSRRLRVDRLVARVGWYRTPAGSPRPARLLVEAVADGWWYTAPLPGSRLVAACLGDRRAGTAVPPHVRASLRGCRQIAGAVCAAHSGRTVPVAGDGWLAIGDAATAFDPLSSRGMAHALDAGQRAAAIVARALEGDPAALAAYAAAVDAEWLAYLGERLMIYRQETRWRDAPFWQSRRRGPHRPDPARPGDGAPAGRPRPARPDGAGRRRQPRVR